MPMTAWGRAECLKNFSKKGIFLFTDYANQKYKGPIPPRHEGTYHDRHGTLARVAMDAAASGVNNARRNARSVRRSRVVLAPRPWRLSLPARAGVATVTKNAAHRGEHE